MLEHIVKNGESIHDILNMYHLELEELMNINLHITDFYNLASGMKIKIPLLNNEVEQILANTESFVQKYYPKISEVITAKETPQTPPLIEDAASDAVLSNALVEPIEKETIKEEPILRKAYPGIIPPTYRGTFKKI